MASCKWFVLVVMAVLALSGDAQHDEKFCTLVTKDESQGKFPPLPKSYSAIAEMKTEGFPDLTYARIRANEFGGRVDLRTKSEHSVTFYSKQTQEVVSVNLLLDTFDPMACMVTKRDDPMGKDVYDIIDQYLHFLDHMNKVYVGPTTVRGLKGDLLRACEFSSAGNFSTKVEWVIANNKSSVGETDLDSMPLQLKISIKFYDGTNFGRVETTDLFEFRSPLNDDTDIMLIPDRYYCANKTNTRPLPQLPNYFSFKSEISLDSGKPNYLFEEYDYIMGLTRMDFYARYPYDKYKKYGKGLLTRIHDFNMNLEFIKDTRSGKCFYQAINESSVDTRRVNNTFYWRMRNPGEFFHLEANRTFQYSGQMKTRGQLAHVFVSQRKVSAELEANVKISVNGTYTWFFVENKDDNTEADKVDLIPIRMEYYSELENYDLNIYSFKTLEPTLMDFSVTDCFNDLAHEQYEMLFKVDATIAARINQRNDQFQHWFEVGVALTSKISFLRIRVDLLKVTTVPDNEVKVRFTLFEKPSLVASDDASLSSAIIALFEAVDGDKFSFFLPNAKNDLDLIQVPKGALKKYTKTLFDNANSGIQTFGLVGQLAEGKVEDKKQGAAGLSTGMFSLLLIATLMVGTVLGCGIMYLLYKKNGRLPGGASGVNYVNMQEAN